MANNGDTDLKIKIGGDKVVGIGSFHKTLPRCNKFGEVDEKAFKDLVKATKNKAKFKDVPAGNLKCAKDATKTAALINPQAGLAEDRLTEKPKEYEMPPAPKVLSNTTAAEMTELYWMALLRDVSFDKFESDADVQTAATEINDKFSQVTGNPGDGSLLQTGVDVPGKAGTLSPITPKNIFRLGLPDEEIGPLISQFFVRDINFGTQKIDQRQRPYKAGMNYLTKFDEWLCAQESGNGTDGKSYNFSNEAKAEYYEKKDRYISTPRDLARFVNKDALHQAYFNAALLLLSGGAKWNFGNPYGDMGELRFREAGFGTLGGPHILALVSEVATRALKIIWYQKWQVHLRLRPEAYGGLVHVQNIGVGNMKRPYGLPDWVADTEAAKRIRALNKKNGEETLLLPMAFTGGSPIHPAYGAGHATVAGICVTVLKGFFRTFDEDTNTPIPLVCNEEKENKGCIRERPQPYAPPFPPLETYITSLTEPDNRKKISEPKMTIEGELNKLASNVAMGRSMGGVHWRTDNSRSLTLGEAVAARVFADITKDLNEKPEFSFRSFSRKQDGEPKVVRISKGKIFVDGKKVGDNPSAL